MAITLEMYTFDKKLNSTKQPLGSGTTVSAALKDNTSVLNPTFIIKTFDLSKNYIKWGSRYYFVDDIVIISNDHAEYVCRTDVLATYKSVIGSSSQYVLRSASQYNPYVIDTKYPAKAESTILKTTLTGLHSKLDSTGMFVIGILSEENSGNAVTYYALTPSQFSTLMSELFDTSYLNAADISTDLQKELVNPIQYVTSCMWFPIKLTDFEGFPTWTYVSFGWWKTSTMCGYQLDESMRTISFDDTFTLTRHPQDTRGIYLNDAPYTRYIVNCYGFGSFPLNPAPFVGNSSGAIEIDVDVFTGYAQMYIAGQSSMLIKTTGQFGVPIQLAQTQGNVISGALSVLGGAVGLAYGNGVGLAQGVVSAIDSMMPQVQSKGSNGSKIDYMQTPTIVGEYRQIVPEDNAQFGRPLCDVKTINTLSGYILCEEADLDSAGSATEKEEIMSFMNSGFYYE